MGKHNQYASDVGIFIIIGFGLCFFIPNAKHQSMAKVAIYYDFNVLRFTLGFLPDPKFSLPKQS